MHQGTLWGTIPKPWTPRPDPEERSVVPVPLTKVRWWWQMWKQFQTKKVSKRFSNEVFGLLLFSLQVGFKLSWTSQHVVIWEYGILWDRPIYYNSRKKVSLCSQYSSYRTPKSRFFCLRILATLAASRFFCLKILATLAACWNKLLTKPVHLAHCSHFLVCGFDHRAIHVRCLIYSFRCVSGVCLMYVWCL